MPCLLRFAATTQTTNNKRPTTTTTATTNYNNNHHNGSNYHYNDNYRSYSHSQTRYNNTMTSTDQSQSKAAGLVAIIGDEDTVTGFLLAGIGHRDQASHVNFLVVDPDRTNHETIVQSFKAFTTRDDISVLLITQTVAQDIRYLISAYDKVIPTILEIPSKDRPYNEGADPIMQRVMRLLGSRD